MSTRDCNQKVQEIEIEGTLKSRPERLPWPRRCPNDPNVELGVDVVKKEKDIKKLVHKFFKVKDYPMDELIQDVFTAILNKNYTRSAHDPRKSSFGHYVYMVANNVCIGIHHKRKRYEKEGDSIDIARNNDEDGKTIEETYCVSVEETEETPILNEFEILARMNGEREVARYIRAVKSGASAEVVREAMSFGGKKFTNKDIRDLRYRISELKDKFSSDLGRSLLINSI